MAQSISFWKGKPMFLLPSDNMSVYLLCYIDCRFRGIFFSPHKPTRHTLPVCPEVHVWSMLQLILQGLVLALQFVLLPAQGWLFSLLLLSFLTLILQYRFSPGRQGSVQPVMLGVVFQWFWAHSEEQDLSALHRAASSLCAWATCHSHWACWDPRKEQYCSAQRCWECFVILYNNLFHSS